MGVLFALGALVCWTFGDFFIQRGTRTVGNWKTLFYIGALGSIVLLPFVAREIGATLSNPSNAAILLLLVIVTLFTALFEFEALKRGKIAVVEPVMSLELPITIGLSLALWGERLSATQGILSLVVFIGIMLAVTIHHSHLHYHKRIFEKGFILAGIGAVGMALVNFLTGVGSQTTSPLFTIWFLHSTLAIICLFYFLYRGETKSILADIRRYPKTIVALSIFDNLAWISFAYAVRYIPISIATTVSESYIALAVLLGIFVNREKLKPHQFVGIALAIGGVILLSAITP